MFSSHIIHITSIQPEICNCWPPLDASVASCGWRISPSNIPSHHALLASSHSGFASLKALRGQWIQRISRDESTPAPALKRLLNLGGTIEDIEVSYCHCLILFGLDITSSISFPTKNAWPIGSPSDLAWRFANFTEQRLQFQWSLTFQLHLRKVCLLIFGASYMQVTGRWGNAWTSVFVVQQRCKFSDRTCNRHQQPVICGCRTTVSSSTDHFVPSKSWFNQ